MKVFHFIIFVLTSINLIAQDTSNTTLLDSLKTELNIAKKENDLSKEILTSYNIMLFNLDISADYNQAYLNAINLEKLILRHEQNKKAIETAPYFFDRLAWIYHSQSRYQKSIETYKKAIKLAEESKLEKLAFKLKSSLAFNLHLTGKIEEAHKILNKLIDVAYSKNDDDLKAKIHYSFYTLFIQENKPKAALSHIIKSIKLTTNMRDYAHRNINIGTCYYNLNELDSALTYTLKGLDIAKKHHYIQQQSNAHSQLKGIYLELKNYERTVHHDLIYNQLSSQLGTQRTVINQEDTNRKELEEKLKLIEDLSNQKLTNQRILFWSSFVLLLILIPFLFILKNRLKLIRKQKQIIEVERNKAKISEQHNNNSLLI
ncbi:hypothetical protein [Psychroserpens sp. MEBiC05023]